MGEEEHSLAIAFAILAHLKLGCLKTLSKYPSQSISIRILTSFNFASNVRIYLGCSTNSNNLQARDNWGMDFKSYIFGVLIVLPTFIIAFGDQRSESSGIDKAMGYDINADDMQRIMEEFNSEYDGKLATMFRFPWEKRYNYLQSNKGLRVGSLKSDKNV